MRAIARSGLLALSALACFGPASTDLALAQAPPAATPPTAPAANAADLKQVLGTVNDEPITRGELLNFLNRYRLPAGSNEQQVYRDAMETLANTHLINQFLARQGRAVAPEKIDDAIAALTKELKDNGSDLPTQLRQSGMTLDDVRKEYANRIRWIDYLNAKATDAELNSFADAHKALFNGTQVRASHILIKTEPTASAADKEKVRQKLAGIKADIESKKTTFAEAANKYSEDPANAEGAGGDIGFFSLSTGIIDEFARAAFDLKKGAISDPVETPYGFHLIQVTDRKEGATFDFEQNKPLVKQVYAADLQKNVLSSERKKAEASKKIVIKPMPSDLFPPAPVVPPAAAPAPATTRPDAK